MRQIEQQMNNALMAGVDWSKDNTRVMRVDTNTTHVYLFGNLIAVVQDTETDEIVLTLSSADWPTVTTKSRLNAICQAYEVQGIYQKAGVWYLEDGTEFEDGHTCISRIRENAV